MRISDWSSDVCSSVFQQLADPDHRRSPHARLFHDGRLRDRPSGPSFPQGDSGSVPSRHGHSTYANPKTPVGVMSSQIAEGASDFGNACIRIFVLREMSARARREIGISSSCQSVGPSFSISVVSSSLNNKTYITK